MEFSASTSASGSAAHDEAMRALEHAERGIRMLSLARVAMSRATSEGELAQAICDVAVESGYGLAYVACARHGDERTMFPVAAAGRGVDDLGPFELLAAHEQAAGELMGASIRTHDAFVIQDFDRQPLVPKLREFAQRHGFRSGVAVPFMIDGAVAGAFAIFAAEADAFSDYDIEAARRLTGDIALGVEAFRRDETLHLTIRALQMTNQARSVVLRAATEDALLQGICDVAVSCGYCMAWIGRAFSDEAKRILPVAAAGEGLDLLSSFAFTWHERGLGVGPTGSAVREGAPMVMQDVTRVHALEEIRAFMGRVHIRAAMALPIAIGGRVEMVLTIYASQLEAFPPAEIALIERLGEDLARGLETMRRDRALQRSREAQQRSERARKLLADSQSVLIRATSEAELLQSICEVAVNSGFLAAWVGRTVDDEEQSILCVAAAGRAHDQLLGTRATWAERDSGFGPTGTSIRLRKPIAVQHIDENPPQGPFRRIAQLVGMRSGMSVPLFVDGEVDGALVLYAAEPNAFREDEMALVVRLGEELAYGIAALRSKAALEEARASASAHANRLEALWRVVAEVRGTGRELWDAIITEAARTLRPGGHFIGSLARLDGDAFVVEAETHPARADGSRTDTRETIVGRRIPLEGSTLRPFFESGVGTYAFDDGLGTLTGRRFKALALRGAILSVFRAGSSVYALWFASTAPVAWTAADRTYVEIIAAFIASQIRDEWQFERLQYHLAYDALTGIFNRSHFRSQVRLAVAESSAPYAIMTLDINGLRDVNEAYGTMIGDAMLVEVATGLRERTLDGEIIGRMGGDVFAVFVPDVPSREYVRERVRHVAERFARPFSTGDREGKNFVPLTASFGIAVFPDDGAEADRIISRSSVAVQAAKERGRGAIVFYEAGMEGDAERKTRFVEELTEAAARDQFDLYVQPHVDLASGAVTGGEALVRWHHPTRGLLEPASFIPLAERMGVIGTIDAWVTRKATGLAAELAARYPRFRLYFNLSARQASDLELIDMLARAHEAGLDLNAIGIEITETDAMRDLEATRSVCRGLQAQGVRVAIDDFGTGYSSLAALKRLPVNVLKIDRTFVSGIRQNAQDEATVELVIQMARIFGCTVLAEGVEETAQLEWLRDRSCTLAQGYLLARPLPLEAFHRWMDGRENRV